MNAVREPGRRSEVITNSGQELPGIRASMKEMANTTARALRLLELLHSGPMRSRAELADRLDIEEKTVRGDAARLSEINRALP